MKISYSLFPNPFSQPFGAQIRCLYIVLFSPNFIPLTYAMKINNKGEGKHTHVLA